MAWPGCHGLNRNGLPLGDKLFIMCDFSIAHGKDECGVHLGCACDIAEVPDGEYKCLKCEEAEEAGGLCQAERILMKRVASCIDHGSKCAKLSDNSRLVCTCKKRKRITKYLVKWKKFDVSQSTWEVDGNILDRLVKSNFDKHVRKLQKAACNKCKCAPVCICKDEAAFEKALDSEK